MYNYKENHKLEKYKSSNKKFDPNNRKLCKIDAIFTICHELMNLAYL